MARKKKENIETVSLDNKPVSPIVQKQEKEVIPKGFIKVPVKVEKQETLKMRNGRVYKELGNGYAMYSDNGETFKI